MCKQTSSKKINTCFLLRLLLKSYVSVLFCMICCFLFLFIADFPVSFFSLSLCLVWFVSFFRSCSSFCRACFCFCLHIFSTRQISQRTHIYFPFKTVFHPLYISKKVFYFQLLPRKSPIYICVFFFLCEWKCRWHYIYVYMCALALFSLCVCWYFSTAYAREGTRDYSLVYVSHHILSLLISTPFSHTLVDHLFVSLPLFSPLDIFSTRYTKQYTRFD